MSLSLLSQPVRDKFRRRPFGGIPYACQWIDEEDIAVVNEVLRSPYLTQGPCLEKFEEALAKTTGARYAVAVSNGSAALHLADVLCGAKPGSLGITSPITFAATANCLLYCGARVRFVDVNAVTGLMDSVNLHEVLAEEAEKDSLKNPLILPVSFAGRPVELPRIQKIAQQFGARVIEDAAHSLGAENENHGEVFSSGSCRYSDAAALSFHPVKHICCGEGGAFLTGDAKLADRARLLRSHGILKPFEGHTGATPQGPQWLQEQTELGWNYRMTEMQAALGLSQLKRLPFFLERRRHLAKRYYEAFQNYPFSDIIKTPPLIPGHACHLFVVHFPNSRLRDSAYEFLRSRQIGSQVHYKPVYRHPYYEKKFGFQRLPGAEKYFEGCLSLPLYPKLGDTEQDRIVETIKDFCRTC